MPLVTSHGPGYQPIRYQPNAWLPGISLVLDGCSQAWLALRAGWLVVYACPIPRSSHGLCNTAGVSQT
jgi:hypothetical protein